MQRLNRAGAYIVLADSGSRRPRVFSPFDQLPLLDASVAVVFRRKMSVRVYSPVAVDDDLIRDVSCLEGVTEFALNRYIPPWGRTPTPEGVIGGESEHITAEGLSRLARLPSLRHIEIAHLNLTADAAKRLSGIGQITNLDLVDAKIERGAVKWLSLMHGLKHLGLSACDVGDSDCTDIAALTALTSLDLDGPA